MKSYKIRRILKDAGCSDRNLLDIAVSEILFLFSIIHTKKYAVVNVISNEDDYEVIYETNDLNDALDRLNNTIKINIAVDGLCFGIVINDTGREYFSGSWYD